MRKRTPAGKRFSVFPHFTRERWLILAQLITLAVLVLGLQFLFNTTGGTLFMFTSVGGPLAGVAIAIVLGVAIHDFRKSHSLFSYEAYEPGEVIVRQGEPGDCAYFIQSGQVEVVNGQGSVVANLSEGEYFGEMALLSDAPRSATVRAAAPTSLAVLGKENFTAMCSLLPSTKEGFLKRIQERAMQSAPRRP